MRRACPGGTQGGLRFASPGGQPFGWPATCDGWARERLAPWPLPRPCASASDGATAAIAAAALSRISLRMIFTPFGGFATRRCRPRNRGTLGAPPLSSRFVQTTPPLETDPLENER